MIHGNSVLKQDIYNGMPCLRPADRITKTSTPALAGCSGCIGAANNTAGPLPMCADLEQAALMNQGSKSGFKPLAWIKANPFKAGIAAVLAYLVIKK